MYFQFIKCRLIGFLTTGQIVFDSATAIHEQDDYKDEEGLAHEEVSGKTEQAIETNNKDASTFFVSRD